VRNRAKLERNPRIGMMYKTWDKMQPEAQTAVLKKGDTLLERVESL
jgi:deoxyribodipyrimidine photolyase-related protein